jgi:2-dehydropantoate 2-reductase
MKILVIGAGVIGTLYGWAARQNGNEVVHLLRPGRAERFCNGVQFDFYDQRTSRASRGQFVYPLQTSESLADVASCDLVIIPTKHYTLEQTLAQIAPLTRHTDTLLLTQNWQGTAALEPNLQPGHFCFGDAKAGGAYQSDPLVCTLKALDYGPLAGCGESTLAKCVAAFGEFMPLRYHENMLHYLWVQYAITGGMWPILVREGSFQKVFARSQNILTAFHAVQECLQVAAARGVDLAQFPETNLYAHPSRLTLWLARTIMARQFTHSEYQKRCSLHALADPAEVQMFYGDLVGTGHRLGISMPVMDSFAPDMQCFNSPRLAW